MTDEKSTHPGARNPKTAKFTVNLASDINDRLEALADHAGANKGTMAAMCLSAGINILERAFLIGVQPYVDQAVNDKSQQFASDVSQAAKE